MRLPCKRSLPVPSGTTTRVCSHRATTRCMATSQAWYTQARPTPWEALALRTLPSEEAHLKWWAWTWVVATLRPLWLHHLLPRCRESQLRTRLREGSNNRHINSHFHCNSTSKINSSNNRCKLRGQDLHNLWIRTMAASTEAPRQASLRTWATVHCYHLTSASTNEHKSKFSQSENDWK
jgi:hypothetical protein